MTASVRSVSCVAALVALTSLPACFSGGASGGAPDGGAPPSPFGRQDAAPNPFGRDDADVPDPFEDDAASPDPFRRDGGREEDGGAVDEDGSPIDVDAGEPGEDAGGPRADADTPRVDMNAPAEDAALPEPDAAVVPGEDQDDDGVLDEDDNCPAVANRTQRDADDDGRGDVCDRCPDDAQHDDRDRDRVLACEGDCDDRDPDRAPTYDELCNGIDDDCDARIDETFDRLGDRCEAGIGACRRVGEITCAGEADTACDAVAAAPADEACNGRDDDCDGDTDEDFDLASDPNHCGACGNVCPAATDCGLGVCAVVRPPRPRVLLCGNSERPLEALLSGAAADLVGASGCDPDDGTQAMLVSRFGLGPFEEDPQILRTYVERGGNLVTEWDASDTLYEAIAGSPVVQGEFFGSCNDNVQAQFQHTPDDPFWRTVRFVPILEGDSGCGFDMSGYPGITPLAGWSRETVSIAYLDAGAGRLWLVEADWQDSNPTFTESSRELLSAMVLHRGGPAPAGECANGVDDDGDRLVDAPDDPGCAFGGDGTESQACPAAWGARDLVLARSTRGTTAGAVDRFDGQCGGAGAPDVVYRVVTARRGTLVVDAAQPGTAFPALVSVRRDCLSRAAELACGGGQDGALPVARVENAPAGEYYVVVDGAAGGGLVSRGGPIEMPPDPHGFVALQDFDGNCWGDGGNDAFDCFGATTVRHGIQSLQVSVALGTEEYTIDGYGVRVVSEMAADNVWRLRFEPTVAGDPRPVTIELAGNLGSDGGTVGDVAQVRFGEHALGYLRTTDGVPADPPVLNLMVPSDTAHLPQVGYQRAGDNVVITATDVRLPLTHYVALSYADPDDVLAAVLADLVAPAGGEAAGAFEVRATLE